MFIHTFVRNRVSNLQLKLMFIHTFVRNRVSNLQLKHCNEFLMSLLQCH